MRFRGRGGEVLGRGGRTHPGDPPSRGLTTSELPAFLTVEEAGACCAFIDVGVTVQARPGVVAGVEHRRDEDLGLGVLRP